MNIILMKSKISLKISSFTSLSMFCSLSLIFSSLDEKNKINSSPPQRAMISDSLMDFLRCWANFANTLSPMSWPKSAQPVRRTLTSNMPS